MKENTTRRVSLDRRHLAWFSSVNVVLHYVGRPSFRANRTSSFMLAHSKVPTQHSKLEVASITSINQ